MTVERPGDQRPRVLMLYYTYSGQAERVLDAVGEVLTSRGCSVERAKIEFTDPQYAQPFSRFPLRRVWPDMLSVLGAQRRKQTGTISTPDTVRGGPYDLVCLGSPTWWQTVSMPMRTFLQSGEARNILQDTPFAVFVVCRRFWEENYEAVRALAEHQGGRFVGEVHFTYPGDNVRSMMSLTSYLGTGRQRSRYFGLPMPPTNVSAEQLEEARKFAAGLADTLFADR